MSNNFEITVIDGENVIEVNNNPVEILTVGMQGPRGIQGIAGEVDPTIIENLQNQITDAQTLAQNNDLKIGTKADQVDLETAEQQIELNRLAILTKADIAALAMLSQLVDTKADQAYVNQQITTLVGSAPEALNTVYELAAAIQDNAGIIDTLNQSVANRVRFDVATQALTEIQKQNARTNIGAESLGTAATLVAAITAASIGAATAAQGTKADTALQSADVAPVALSGLFNSLVGQNKIFDVVFGAYALGSNTAVVATDTLGQIIGKLQAQINNMGSSGGLGGGTASYPSFTSNAAKVLAVNATEDGVEWTAAVTPEATELAAGKAKIATTAIAQAGVNDTDFITAKKLRDALNVGGRIHATLYASTVSSVTTILKSKNILSVVRTATGRHTITTASDMDDVNYTLLGLSSLQNSSIGGFIMCENFGTGSTPIRTINSFQLETINGSAYVDAWVWGVSVVC